MKKKYVIGIIAIILAAIAMLNTSLAIYSRQYTTYEFEVTPNNVIDNVVINGTKIKLDRYVSDSVYIKEIDDEESKINVLTSDSKAKITIMTSVIDDIFVNYKEGVKNPIVYKDGIKQDIENTLYMNNTNFIEDIKESLGIYSMWLFLGYLVIMIFIVTFISRFLNMLKDNSAKIVHILGFILAVFFIYASSFYVCLYVLKYAVVIPIAIAVILGIYYLKDSLKENIENIYIYIATIVGITMLFIIPPFNVPDELAHFVKSYTSSYINNNDEGYTNLPVSIENFAYKYEEGSHDTATNYNGKNYFSDMVESLQSDKLSENTFKYTNTKFLGIGSYLPSAITVFIARVVGLAPIWLLIIGRFTNLLLTLVFCYLALKYIPCFKIILFVIVTLPMFLQQAAGINQDWLTNISVVLIFTFIMKFKYMDRKINYKDLILLSVLAFVLACSKFGYFPVLALIFLIPNDKFKDKKTAILFKALFIIIPLIISYMQNSSLRIPKTNNPYYTFEYAISNPIDVVKIFYNTAMDRFPLDMFRGYFDGFGVHTQWHSSLLLYICIAIYVLVISTSGNDEKKLNWKERLVMVIIACMIIGIVYCAMFFGWTHKGLRAIDGLQPRYFIPAALLLYTCLANDNIKLNVKNRNLFVSACTCIVHILCFYTIILGFYCV